MDKITEIETTTDFQLSVQKVKCYLTDSKGKRRAEDETCLLVSGYDPQTDREINDVVTLSKEETFRLIQALTDLLTG